MNNAGFDWLNLAAHESESSLPPPPVSFGVTPNTSSSSVNLSTLMAPQTSDVTGLNENVAVEETAEDLTVPLDLHPTQLSADEAKTYLRWYNDIVLTRGTRLIRLHDVFAFLNNFKLDAKLRRAIEKIFKDVVSLEIGQFFALMRVIAHTVAGLQPRRKLISVPAPLLKPKSILCVGRKKHKREDEESGSPTPTNGSGSKLDLDTFTQFILTGDRPDEQNNSKKRKKRVKFSDELEMEPIHQQTKEESVNMDLTLPMDQLLGKVGQRKTAPPPPTYTANEEEELKEMQDQVNHFQHVKNVDSALIHGTPSNIPSVFFEEARLNTPSPDFQQQQLLAPNHTGPIPGLLSPSNTGPAPFPSTLLNPNLTGSTSPSFADQIPLQPSMTGSLSSSMRQHSQFPTSFSPANVPLGSSPNHLAPPQVPVRARSASSPTPSNYNVQAPTEGLSIADQLQQQYNAKNGIRSVSPLAPPPPPSRRPRTSSSPAPPPPPPRVSSAPGLPPKIPLGQPSFQQHQYEQPEPHHLQNDSRSTSYTQGSVYDRVLQDFSIQGQPLHQTPPPLTNGKSNNPYSLEMNSNNSSTADILGDLKALQSEVDRLQYFQR